MHNGSKAEFKHSDSLIAVTVGQQRIAVLPKPGAEVRTNVECLPEWRDSILWDQRTQSRVIVRQPRCA